MSNTVPLATPPADPASSLAPRRQAEEVASVAGPPAPPLSQHADVRLIIEEAGEPGRYVYTVIDRVTGEILSQLPRDEVLRMKEQANYAAGALFKGEA